MYTFTVRLRLVGCLLLLGTAVGGAAAPRQTPAPPATDLPPELALVPPDAIAFCHIQFDRIVMHPMVLNLLRRLPPGQVKEIGEQSFPVAELIFRSFGLPMEETASLTIFANATGPGDADAYFCMVLNLRQPADRKKLLEKVLAHAEEKKAGDRTYFVPKDKESSRLMAVHFIDERRVLVIQRQSLEEKVIEKLFGLLYQKKTTGPLSATIAQAKEKLFVLGLHVSENLRREFGTLLGALPEEYSWVEALLQLQVGSLTVDLGSAATCNFRLRYTDAAKARDGEEAAKHGLKFLREQLEPVLLEMQDKSKKAKDPSDVSHPALALLRELETLLKTARVQTRDKELQVTLTLKTDDTFLDQFARLLTTTWKKEKKREQDQGGLARIGIAIHNYHGEQDHLPKHAIYSKQGQPLLSWRVAILPYLGEEKLYKEFKLEEPWDSAHNKKLLPRMPAVYRVSGGDKEQPQQTYYKVFVSKKGNKPAAPFIGDEKLTLGQMSAQDGPANTVMVIEGGDPVPWTKPEDLPFDANKPLPRVELPFRDGINVLFGDGTVRKLKKGLPEKLFKQLITWNGGETEDFSSWLMEDE